MPTSHSAPSRNRLTAGYSSNRVLRGISRCPPTRTMSNGPFIVFPATWAPIRREAVCWVAARVETAAQKRTEATSRRRIRASRELGVAGYRKSSAPAASCSPSRRVLHRCITLTRPFEQQRVRDPFGDRGGLAAVAVRQDDHGEAAVREALDGVAKPARLPRVPPAPLVAVRVHEPAEAVGRDDGEAQGRGVDEPFPI